MFLRKNGGAVGFGRSPGGRGNPFDRGFGDDDDDFGGGFGRRGGFGNDMSPNRRGNSGGADYSPLFLAIEAGDYTSVFRLLNSGMNPNITDSKLVPFFFSN